MARRRACSGASPCPAYRACWAAVNWVSAWMSSGSGARDHASVTASGQGDDARSDKLESNLPVTQLMIERRRISAVELDDTAEAGVPLKRLHAMLGGAVVIESIFSLPGLGSLAVSAAQTNDIVVLQGATLFFGLLAVAINLAVDLSYGWLDPRIRVA